MAALAYADELIQTYADLYGELASETLALLEAVEEDLAMMTEAMDTLNTALQEINAALQEGQTLAAETMAKLESAAQDLETSLADVQMEIQGLSSALPKDMENRVNQALAVLPDHVPADRQAAIQSAFDYIDAVRAALADQKLSKDELAQIVQKGANAAAGLSAHGGPQLQDLSAKINALTGQLARGQVPSASLELGNLEASLPARPSRP